jgi:hypothetical protein
MNAGAGSAVLYIQHDFYNTIFKTEQKLYICISSGSAPPPFPRKNSGCVPDTSLAIHRVSLARFQRHYTKCHIALQVRNST